MKALAIILASLLSAYAAAGLWAVPSNALPESGWCRAWFCQTDAETQHEYQEYLRASVQQAPKTLAGFAEILRRDPASAFRWCDLAEAMVEPGRIESARYAINRAIELGPHSAPILLRAANFYFRIDDAARAVEFGRTILGQIPDYDAILFSDYDRFEVPVETVLDKGLPVDRRATRAYLSHLLGSTRLTDSRIVWNWVRAHHFADDPLASSYVSFLVSNHAYETAAERWVDYLGSRRGDYPQTNLLFNGDFESAPTGSLFDWQIGSTDGVRIARDGVSEHSGQYSVHLQFDGTTNVALDQVSQSCVLSAGTYTLQYFVKTEGITTNEGVRLRALDPENPGLLNVVTEPASGTSDWRRVEARFTITPRTHLVRVQIVRLPSQKFDNKIAGSAWIDSVRLRRAGS